MLNALFWGLIATSSLVLGGMLGSWFTIGKRRLGIIMAFGAGVLICAVAYELILEAVQSVKGSGIPAVACLTGALTFFIGDRLIGKLGGEDRKGIEATHKSSLVVPLVLGIILDGIPETMVIGLSLRGGGSVSLAMLVAVFISNLPESIAATTGMRSGAWSRTKILLFWLAVVLLCTVSAGLGYLLLGNASELPVAFVQAFAGGAILVMLANTMMPEAFEHGGKLAGIFTVLGFELSVIVVLLEKG
ncbi:MAG: ZIP family zinc transporter [Deltaproteobacteria bacterium]|nr:MAG: ZIP family zinc transporter [Deltaproteobacteria bacterium]